MKVPWAVLLVAGLLWACADAEEVNSTFRQHQVSWYTFDRDARDGLKPLPGFEQAQKIEWVPQDRGVVATDMVSAAPGLGAVAVSRLGLLVVSDPSGALLVQRPDSRVDLAAYRTGPLLVSEGRVFLTLSGEAPGDAPATLVWWAPGQTRIAPFPLPSQFREPERRAVAFAIPDSQRPYLGLKWKVLRDGRWIYEQTAVSLAGGAETSLDVWPQTQSRAGVDDPRLRERLGQTVGVGVELYGADGDGPALAFTQAGWVAVVGESGVRVYRLPDLGIAGRYTHAVSLARGWVLSWETTYRAFAGAAGLVYIPRPVLAP